MFSRGLEQPRSLAKSLDEFINYVDALLRLCDDPKKLAAIPPGDIKREINVFLERARDDLGRTLDFSKRLKSGEDMPKELDPERIKELQAGSARYFASMAKSFNDYESAVKSILEKDALTEADLKKMQESLEGILEVISEAGASRKDSKGLGELKKMDATAIISLVKSGLKGLDAKVKKNVEKLLGLMERMTSSPP